MHTVHSMDSVHNPHDALFREIYSRKAEARSFLAHYLPEDVLAVLDVDSLDICKDSFVDEELKAYYSDILYSVQLAGQPGYVYVLFEHKSYPDRLIHLQILDYMLKIWRLDQHKGETTRKLPIILPVVLYHGGAPWMYGRQLLDLLCGPTDQLTAYVPDFRILLTDLSAYADDDIQGTIVSRVVLLLFKHIFDPDLHDRLPDILKLLRELSTQESGLRMLETVLRYVYSAVERLSADEIVDIARQTLHQQGGGISMTIAQKLRQEGRQEGRQQGLENGEVIGGILFAQRMLKLTIYGREELEQKDLNELRHLLTKLEAAVLEREQPQAPERPGSTAKEKKAETD